jgi:ABC-2 type transport system permease protein
MLLIPAISMRLWSEERKSGTLELLMTLPVSLADAVLGKFLAAWAFTGIALGLTFPLWLTVNYLGNPDNTVIAAGYLGSLLMAGGFLSIGACISALTRNQVVAFVISFVICFAFNLSGFPLVLDFFSGWAPQAVVEAIGSFSFLTHFNSIQKGVIDLRDVIFFATLIALWLYANMLAIEHSKGH